MGLDVRLPVGLLFSFLGLVLAGYGLWSGINLNLSWGLVLLAFGLTMFGFGARRGR